MPDQWELKTQTGIKPDNTPNLSVGTIYKEKDRTFKKPPLSIPSILIKTADKIDLCETGIDETLRLTDTSSSILKGIIVGVIVGVILFKVVK